MSPDTQVEAVKTVMDSALAVGAIASPWWLQLFESANHMILMVGGLVLLLLRIGVAWREYKRKGRG